MDKSQVETLDIENNLNLSVINLPNASRNITVPNEVNSYLRGQLFHVTKEKEELEKKLAADGLNHQKTERKLKELSERINEYETVYNTDSNIAPMQLANSKILELTKKLREKNSEIEVTKTKCSRLERSLDELKSEKESETTITKEEINVNDPNELKRLQEKLNQTATKLRETKDTNFKLKHDLQLANKWLQQEIGDSFETIQTLNNSNSNWRGRAQIICDLQQKNLKLKEKLQENQNTVESNNPTNLDKKIETLTNENAEVKKNLEDLRRKFDANKARCRALETECSMLKTKVLNLSEINECDQEKIASLTSAISGRNDRKTYEVKQKEQIIKKLEQNNELLRMELEKEKCNAANKDKELEEKQEQIEAFAKKIRKSRPPSSYSQRPENPDLKVISRLEGERLKLLELTEVQNKRLEEERQGHAQTQNHLRMERQRGVKLEANLARLELENSARSSYRCSRKLPVLEEDNFKDQLQLAEEKIKALQTRLDIEIYERKKDLQEFTNILRGYRRD